MHYSDFTIKWASSNWEIEQANKLRRDVFCNEQKIFFASDQDEIDEQAQCLVAIANQGGWHEKVVGTVRIHQPFKAVWWGSRLAVHPDFRHQKGLGAALIKLAVSSAHALGCRQFLAQVQMQNERLFKKLNWQTQGYVDLRGQQHAMMEADLTTYPPCHSPYSGYVLNVKHYEAIEDRFTHKELAPAYLQPSGLLTGSQPTGSLTSGAIRYVS